MMTRWLFVVLCLWMVGLVQGGIYTVTDEVWFDVSIDGGEGPEYTGRFVIALFGEAAPMTVMNIVSIARGYKKAGGILHYKNTIVHRVVPDFVVQMGDITNENGAGGKSIYGERFDDEEFTLSHRAPGWVSMANHGENTNNSQFFILLTKARWLDGKHVVFGKVVSGFDVVEAIGEVPVNPENSVPHHKILIKDCGVNILSSRYEIPEDSLSSTKEL